MEGFEGFAWGSSNFRVKNWWELNELVENWRKFYEFTHWRLWFNEILFFQCFFNVSLMFSSVFFSIKGNSWQDINVFQSKFGIKYRTYLKTQFNLDLWFKLEKLYLKLKNEFSMLKASKNSELFFKKVKVSGIHLSEKLHTIHSSYLNESKKVV